MTKDNELTVTSESTKPFEVYGVFFDNRGISYLESSLGISECTHLRLTSREELKRLRQVPTLTRILPGQTISREGWEDEPPTNRIRKGGKLSKNPRNWERFYKRSR